MKPLLIIFMALFAISSLGAVWFHDQNNEARKVVAEQAQEIFGKDDQISSLKRELNFMRQYKDWHDKTEAKIAEIRSEGYKPDRLLIAQIYKRAKVWQCVNVDSLFQISKIETSYGSNNVTGELGEEGWPQFTEETLRFQILFFEGDTTGFKMSNYSDNVTATDWAFTTYMYAKMHKPKNKNPNWVNDWNRGAYMRSKESGGK